MGQRVIRASIAPRVSVTVPSTIAPGEAWQRLALDGMKPGSRYSMRSLEGVVTTADPPESFGGVIENLNDGLFNLLLNATSFSGDPRVTAPNSSNPSGLES